MAGHGRELVQRHRRAVADLGHDPPLEVGEAQLTPRLRRREAAHGAEQAEQARSEDAPVRRIDVLEPWLAPIWVVQHLGALFHLRKLHKSLAKTKPHCESVANMSGRNQWPLAAPLVRRSDPSSRSWWTFRRWRRRAQLDQVNRVDRAPADGRTSIQRVREDA